ncbi:hypothetical protein AB3A98_002694 [Vibrio parahaemolyticus]
MILSKRSVASKILIAITFSAGIMAGDYVRAAYSAMTTNDEESRYQISQVVVDESLADACYSLEIHYSNASNVLHDISAECDTGDGVYRARETAISNIDYSLIEEIPAFYKGIEILSKLKAMHIADCYGAERCLTVRVDTHDEKMMALMNSGELAEKINPLLVRMQLSSEQL